VLVLGALGFRDRETIGILEDDDEHEHEDDSSNSEFGVKSVQV
jgi:hypothetical protein